MNIRQDFIYKALGEIINRIEACGASTELTNAVSLAADLKQSIGNKFNPANTYAFERVKKQLELTTVSYQQDEYLAFEYRIFKDGNFWCAVTSEFTNIQESEAGFGLKPHVALRELLEQIDNRENGDE